MKTVAEEGREGGRWRRRRRRRRKEGVRGKGRRVDFWGLKHISIHGEEEATDSRETERDQTESATQT